MEFAEAVLPNATAYLEFGELRFYENPKPRFTFYNSRAKKPEIACYSSTIRAIANCLPEAQAVARAYIAGKKTEPGEKTDDIAAVFDLTETVAGTETEAAIKEDYIFSNLVSQYGNEILMKNMLQVSVYNEQPKIWLKPWWRKADEPGNIWYPSNSGFQFSIHDSPRTMVWFADNVLAEFNKRTYGTRDKRNPWKPTLIPPAELDTAFLDLIPGKKNPWKPTFLDLNPGLDELGEFSALFDKAEKSGETVEPLAERAEPTEPTEPTAPADAMPETEKVSGSRKRKMRK
jgi:hypothetical protein